MNDFKTRDARFFRDQGACDDACEFVDKCGSLDKAWKKCADPLWMRWLSEGGHTDAQEKIESAIYCDTLYYGLSIIAKELIRGNKNSRRIAAQLEDIVKHKKNIDAKQSLENIRLLGLGSYSRPMETLECILVSLNTKVSRTSTVENIILDCLQTADYETRDIASRHFCNIFRKHSSKPFITGKLAEEYRRHHAANK